MKTDSIGGTKNDCICGQRGQLLLQVIKACIKLDSGTFHASPNNDRQEEAWSIALSVLDVGRSPDVSGKILELPRKVAESLKTSADERRIYGVLVWTLAI